MKIRVKNLGPLRQAEFELGDLTIICGENNTGKTYATYALFGFLSYWREAFSTTISSAYIAQLLTDGVTKLDLRDFVKNAGTTLTKGCAEFTRQLPSVFASSERLFTDTEFNISIDQCPAVLEIPFERTIGAAKTQLFTISKKPDSSLVTITLLVEKDSVKVPREVISGLVGNSINEIIFGRYFPKPFIASAERTGAAIFRKELNFARNRLLDQIGSKDKDIDPIELIRNFYSDYAWPVETNVDFTRQLETVSKKTSFLTTEHPEILDEFSNIIGGEYSVTKNDELYFLPQKGKRIKLTMDESSSAVRSLLDVGFYLRHVARKGDLLMVDEPELNLHPENQRRVARLFARLVNTGIKVFITTHSDYIIKELNTSIMLKQENGRFKHISEREGYRPEELLNVNQIRVYIAEEALVQLANNRKRSRCLTLVPADIDPRLGIEARSFDKTIDEMNRIQEEIIWGANEDDE